MTLSMRLASAGRRIAGHASAPLFRNAYALILSSGATSGLGVVYWMLATRHYPAEVVGLNSALISAMLLVAGVAQLGLVSVMTRFLPRAGASSARLVLIAYALTLGAGALGGLAFALHAGRWAPALADLSARPELTLWFAGAVMAWCIFTVQDAVLAGMRQTVWVPVENAAFALAKIGLLLAFALAAAPLGIFASWTICAAAVLLPVNALIFGRLLPRHMAGGDTRTGAACCAPPAMADNPAHIARFAAANYLGALLSLSTTTLLPLLVVQRLGPSANAYFAQPWLFAGALQLAAGNMAVSLTVEAAADRQRLASYARRALAHTARLLVPAVAAVVAGAPLLLGMFGPDYAAEGTAVLRLLALGALPNAVVMIYLSAARVLDRVGEIVAIQAILSAATLALSHLLIDTMGIAGVGAAWLAAQSLGAAWVGLAWALRRLQKRGSS